MHDLLSHGIHWDTAARSTCGPDKPPDGNRPVQTVLAVHTTGFEKAKFEGFPVPTKNGMGRQGPMPFATEGMMGQTPSGV